MASVVAKTTTLDQGARSSRASVIQNELAALAQAHRSATSELLMLSGTMRASAYATMSGVEPTAVSIKEAVITVAIQIKVASVQPLKTVTPVRSMRPMATLAVRVRLTGPGIPARFMTENVTMHAMDASAQPQKTVFVASYTLSETHRISVCVERATAARAAENTAGLVAILAIKTNELVHQVMSA